MNSFEMEKLRQISIHASMLSRIRAKIINKAAFAKAEPRKQDIQPEPFIKHRKPLFPPIPPPSVMDQNSELGTSFHYQFQFHSEHFAELHQNLVNQLPEISQCGGNRQDCDEIVSGFVAQIGNTFAQFNKGNRSPSNREHILEAQEQLEDDGGAEDVDSLIFKKDHSGFGNKNYYSASRTEEQIVNRLEDPETVKRRWREQHARQMLNYEPTIRMLKCAK